MCTAGGGSLKRRRRGSLRRLASPNPPPPRSAPLPAQLRGRANVQHKVEQSERASGRSCGSTHFCLARRHCGLSSARAAGWAPAGAEAVCETEAATTVEPQRRPAQPAFARCAALIFRCGACIGQRAPRHGAALGPRPARPLAPAAHVAHVPPDGPSQRLAFGARACVQAAVADAAATACRCCSPFRRRRPSPTLHLPCAHDVGCRRLHATPLHRARRALPPRAGRRSRRSACAARPGGARP